MAKLIPAFVDESAPPGEIEVFNLLSAGPDDWVALHSLDLTPWRRGLRTEIDFVVIVPDVGIACVEVKSHDRISFDGSQWEPATLRRSPFKQAQDGCFSFRRRLVEIASRYRNVPVVHCCVFPNAVFEIHHNLSVQHWELIDRRVFRSLKSANEFCVQLRSRMCKAIEADARLAKLEQALTRTQMEELVALCVPVQRRHVGARDEIVKRQEDADRALREQQRPILHLVEANDRVIVSGAAGTGKTLLAMEIAQRAAESGKRVALLCFNSLVGAMMEHHFQSKYPNLIVGSAIRVITRMAEISIPEAPTSAYWENDLAAQIQERLTDPDFKSSASVDLLIIDEAQDILARPWLWDCVRAFAPAVDRAECFVLLGDFDYQVLADRSTMAAQLSSLIKSSKPARWMLSENCRNYRIVGETSLRLSGLRLDVYSGYRRSGGSQDNYDVYFYDSLDEQLSILGNWLAEFRQRGYKASEITLLSFRSDQDSSGAKLAQRKGLEPARRAGARTGYCTIQAFKGMENKVVILTDMALSDTTFHRDVFYTGMTRSTESVRILCDAKAKSVLLAWLGGGAR